MLHIPVKEYATNIWYNQCLFHILTQYKNNVIKEELTKKDYFGDDERLYIDMRRSKGYTNELEKLTHNDGSVTLTIKLKKEAEKK